MLNLWSKLKKEFRLLGPGFITGAADDDPSGIATYSLAGAQFGYKLNFLSWVLLPLMIALQEASARLGMVSGMGLAGILKKYYPRRLLFTTVVLLLIANIINIGANLGIMAASVQMVLGLPFLFWLLLITTITILAEIFVPYQTYAKFLRFASLFLLAYVFTALFVTKDWLLVLKETLTPHLSFNQDFLMTVVAFLGTTISPYLFFWQAGEEVEEEIAKGKVSDFALDRPKLSGREIRSMRQDTDIGMIFSNIITFFIVATTAATLYKNGITDIATPQQAALALKPLAGDLAYLLFTIGIVGIGLQSVPVLSGSVAYAISEAFGFSEGLGKNFNRARMFYLTLAIATLVGVFINILGINTIKALYFAAIVNGIVAVPLIFIIMKLADNEKVVDNFRSPKSTKIFGWLAFWFMLLAVVLMLGTTVKFI